MTRKQCLIPATICITAAILGVSAVSAREIHVATTGDDSGSGSEASPFQALRVPNKPIWASQFHPELDRRANEDRYRHYLEGYASHMSAEELEASLQRFDDSPEASGLLRRFVELVF